MSSALALGYLFWTRHHRGLTVLGSYWLITILSFLALPAGYFQEAAKEERWPIVIVFCLLYSSLALILGYLIVLFTFGRDAQLEVRESAFPVRLWTLPLPTRALVRGIMLWGSAVMILGWVPLGWAAQRPCGIDLPLVWPGLVMAVVLAWLQTILWTPLPLPWLRVFLVVPVSCGFVYTPLAILALNVPSILVNGLLALLLLAAYGTAAWSVARARRGDNVTWGWPSWLHWPWAATDTRQPFASALRAQQWFEWKSHGLTFPIVVAVTAAIELPLIAFFAGLLDDAERGGHPLVPSWLLHEVGSLWLVLASLLLGPLLLASGNGMEIARFARKTYRMPSFLATRPVSEAMLVRAKFTTAAWSTLAGWGVLAIGVLLWLGLASQASEAIRQFEAMRQRHGPTLFWGWLLLLVGGAIVLSWLQMVQHMWIGLTGNARLVERSAFGFGAFIGLIALGYWLTYHSVCASILASLLPWLAGAAVVVKSGAALWSVRALRQRALIPSAVLGVLLFIWLAVAAGLFAALSVLLPERWFSVSGIILGIVLFLPLTRLALAPLALFWNRHR